MIGTTALLLWSLHVSAPFQRQDSFFGRTSNYLHLTAGLQDHRSDVVLHYRCVATVGEYRTALYNLSLSQVLPGKSQGAAGLVVHKCR